MKKLFTLIALLTCFLGAKAEWVQDYKIDYSTYKGFPFYVMGYVPEWYDGVMTDFGANFKYVEVKDDAEETSDVIVTTNNGVQYYKIALDAPAWHQYFIADGIPTELDGAYTVKAMVKASEAVTINVNMGWGWGEGQSTSASVSIGTEWTEVEWEYSGIGGTSCNLVAQPGTSTATIEWKYLTVGHNAKAARPTVWQEWLNSDGQPFVLEEGKTNDKYMGNAETPWGDLANVKYNDAEKNFLVCAWSKEKGHNMDENGEAWNPFPASIEEVDGSKVFVCHGQPATTEGDPSAWDNQFWIQSPQSWKEGTQIKLHFRYKASQPAKADTQIHKQTPSDYLHWNAVGEVAFTTEWQDFDKTFTFDASMATGWSIAFNLNKEVKDAVDFYFDDLSWQTMVLDEGFFVASSNAANAIEYDFDNATQFEQDPDEDEGVLFAIVGEQGKKETWINEIMISTIRGNDQAFKGATIKPTTAIISGEWTGYTEASLAKIKLPGAGVWKIQLDPNTKEICFTQLEGEAAAEPIDVVTNKTEVVVKGQERDWKPAKDDGTPQDGEEGVGTGQPWDNQFFFVANRVLEPGEVTHLKFSYKASKAAKSTTQTHGTPGAYIHWAAIGDVNFTEEWQTFDQDYTVPKEADGSEGKQAQSIAFNLAEIKDACDYYIKDVQWYLKDETLEEGKTYENLIDATGAKNFYVKEGAGTNPHEFEGSTGITNIEKNVKTSSAIYNIAGQRVSKDFKGLVVKDGKKMLNK